MIDYWHHPVVIRLMLCIVVFRVGVQDQRLYQRVPSRQVHICPFRHFYCSYQTTKCTGKTSRRIRERELFWDTENHVCIGL